MAHVAPLNRPERWEALDRQGVRCDGNNRRCVNRAVDQYEAYRLSPVDGSRLSDGPETLRSCGRHRAQFLTVATLEVVETFDIPRWRGSRQPNG